MAGEKHRHSFRSFRQRVDSLKIDPHAKLSVRAHDYVDTSYFDAFLKHWLEINISGNFVEFADAVEPLSKSLAQIILHKEEIFSLLELFMAKDDSYSLQAFSELMTQFAHDLGPDFMPFYGRYLRCILLLINSANINDSQNLKNTSNKLEWCFTSLAFVFKYLSKELSEDLTVTFELLHPIFSGSKKDYLRRFCAESMSFLLRKLSEKNMENFFSHAIKEQENEILENDLYRDSLCILISETMTNSNGSFHSKTKSVLQQLWKICFEESDPSFCFTRVLSAVIVRLVAHASAEHVDRIYLFVLKKTSIVFKENSSCTAISKLLKILVSCIFAKSGKMLKDWLSIHEIIKLLESTLPKISLVYWTEIIFLFTLIFRNAELHDLVKLFPSMWHLVQLMHGSYRLEFLESCINLSEIKSQALGVKKRLHDTVTDLRDADEFLKLSVLIQSSVAKNGWLEGFRLPSNIANQIINDLNIAPNASVLEISWRLRCLQLADINSAQFLQITLSLRSSNIPDPEQRARLWGLGLLLLRTVREETLDNSLTDVLHSSFQYGAICKSLDYLKGLEVVLSKYGSEIESKYPGSVLEAAKLLIGNLKTADRSVRTQSSRILLQVPGLLLDTSQLLEQFEVIDSIDFTVTNASQMRMRIRNLFKTFSELKQPLEESSIVLSSYTIGLLHDSFQPSWLAVNEGLKIISSSLFLSILGNELLNEIQKAFVREDSDSEEPEIRSDTCSDDASAAYYEDTLGTFLAQYISILKATDPEALSSFGTEHEYHSKLVRSRLISCLKSNTRIADKKAEEIGELVLKVFGDEEFGLLSDATLQEKIDMLSICGSLQNLSRLSVSDELKALFLNLLPSKKPELQAAALNSIFTLKVQFINKYRDNLKNLLDDKLFKDEFAGMFSLASENQITEQESSEVIPVVLRILLGKVRSSKRHSKAGVKSTLNFALPNLSSHHIRRFIEDLSSNIPWPQYFETMLISSLSLSTIKHMQGFVNMVTDISESVGYTHADALGVAVRPVLFALVATQFFSDRETEFPQYASFLKTVRSSAMRALNVLSLYIGDNFDWSAVLSVLYTGVIQPRLAHFHEENTQLSSSLLQILLKWIERKTFLDLYLMDDMAIVKSVMALVDNVHCKEEVLVEILDFCISSMTKKESEGNRFISFLAVVVDGLLKSLPRLVESLNSKEVIWRSSTLLLLIVDKGFIDDDSTRQSFIKASSVALVKPAFFVGVQDKANLFISISGVISQLDGPFEVVADFFKVCSSSLRLYDDGMLRGCVLRAFESIANRYPDASVVYGLLESMNRAKRQNIKSIDVDSAIYGFSQLTPQLFQSLRPLFWRPLIDNALFYMRYDEEPALRDLALASLCAFVESSKISSNVEEFQEAFFDIIDPALRKGLKFEENYRSGFIHLLLCAVTHSLQLPRFESMNSLTLDVDGENFFTNINHIQITQRQKAIRAVPEWSSLISTQCLNDYVIPILEIYLLCKDEKLRNLSEDTKTSYGRIVSSLPSSQFKHYLRRWLLAVKQSEQSDLKDKVRIVVQLVTGHCEAMRTRTSSNQDTSPIETEDGTFLLNDIVLPIRKILSIRNDETIAQRIPLLEAATQALLVSSEERVRLELPGLLTSSCQVLRSKSQELRDATRKQLSRVACLIGPTYMRYLIRELKAALSRGSQIHVLSYTLHSVLTVTYGSMKYGDLDDSSSLIIDIIMEDIFGAAGQDKDAELYISKMKEVKAKKSFDTAQLLASKISLENFFTLLRPIKLLLSENIPLKSQQYLSELLRRFSQGLNQNEKSNSQETLVLCYDIHKQSLIQQLEKKPRASQRDESHFLVDLNSKKYKMDVDKNKCIITFQTLAFELLRDVLFKNSSIATVSNLDGFIPLIEESLSFSDENLIQASFKLLIVFAKIPFSSERALFFKSTVERAFDLLQSAPSTNAEVPQVCLKYITAILRHNENVEVPTIAIKHLLQKIQPDLEEPQRQSPAFNFLRAVLSRRIEIPEVYDIMDKLLPIMVLNHHKEIRDVCRTNYFKFLMHYNQSEQRLEKRLKFVISNLSYPTQTGRETMMELMHSIILRASDAIIGKIATSFFVALSNSLASDSLTRCREMASSLLIELLKRIDEEKALAAERLCTTWMSDKSKALMKRCGLLVYKTFIATRGIQSNEIDKQALHVIGEIMETVGPDHEDIETDWEDVYVSLEILGQIYMKTEISQAPPIMWVVNCLLYPHSWVRSLTTRIVTILLQKLEVAEHLDLQLVCSKFLRQLSAPGLSESLAEGIAKSISLISVRWISNRTLFSSSQDTEPDRENTYHFATDMIVFKICGILKSLSSKNENYLTKKTCIKILALLTQQFPEDMLEERFLNFMLALLSVQQSSYHDDSDEEEIRALVLLCLEQIKERVGTNSYVRTFNSISQDNEEKRRMRKARRAQLVTSAPEIAANRKIKKHERARKNRNQRDENGLYKPKRKRIV